MESGYADENPALARESITVSLLNRAVAELLTRNFRLVRVRGEIADFARAASGHWYFTLKDDRAQVRCAMFRGRNLLADFAPREGDEVEVLAQVGLYEPRGEYQLTVQALQRSGLGRLYERFLELYPMHVHDMHSELLFEKYANRIGYNMHNKFLAVKNIEHLKFIKNLVADIEHNVIVPNMVYKLFLRRLRGMIMKNVEIESQVSEHCMHKEERTGNCESLLREFNEVNQGLTGELENIEKHYTNMSLFLETQFRRDHFDHGKLSLRSKACHMKRDVVQPQLER